MDVAPGTFTLRIDGDFNWEHGLPLWELRKLLSTFGQALQTHYLEGVRTGKFQKPSEHFPASFLTEFALLEFEPETSTAVLAPPSNSEFRKEAALALDNLASLLDAFIAHEPLPGTEARALVLALDVCDKYVISLDWRGRRSVTFDEKSLLWLQPLVQRLNEEDAHVRITELESLRTEIRLLHWAPGEAETELRRELARLGFTVRELDGSRMSNRASIYAEGARAGLADDLWEEWNFEPTERTAIVWSHADDIAHKVPQAFVEQVVEILRQCDATEKQVDLFLVGDWVALDDVELPAPPLTELEQQRLERQLAEDRVGEILIRTEINYAICPEGPWTPELERLHAEFQRTHEVSDLASLIAQIELILDEQGIEHTPCVPLDGDS